MARMKDSGRPSQAAFEFDAAGSTPGATDRTEAAVRASPVPEVASVPVVMLADRRRSRHLDVVRKLLAETGVFRAD